MRFVSWSLLNDWLIYRLFSREVRISPKVRKSFLLSDLCGLSDFPTQSYLCPMFDVILKKGKEKAVLQRHPWLFSGAIERVKGKPANGDTVRLLSDKGEFMAYGFYNSQSRVALRLLEWDEAV